MQLLPNSVAEIENLYRLVVSFQVDLFRAPVEFVVELTEEEEADWCRDFVWEITTDETSIMNVAAALAKTVFTDILVGFGHTTPITRGEAAYDNNSIPYDYVKHHIELVQHAEEVHHDLSDPALQHFAEQIALMGPKGQFAAKAADYAFSVLRLEYQREERAKLALRQLAELATEYAEFVSRGVQHERGY